MEQLCNYFTARIAKTTTGGSQVNTTLTSDTSFAETTKWG